MGLKVEPCLAIALFSSRTVSNRSVFSDEETETETDQGVGARQHDLRAGDAHQQVPSGQCHGRDAEAQIRIDSHGPDTDDVRRGDLPAA